MPSESPFGAAVKITAGEVRKRKAYLQITRDDERRVQKAHRLIQRHQDSIIERFYQALFSHEHTRRILDAPGMVDRLKGLQRKYFERLTLGPYNVDYFHDRMKIGLAHDRIGLTPEWYMGAYNIYMRIVADVLSREMGRDYQGFFETISSITKIMFLDMGLAMDAYVLAGQARLKERNELLEQLDSKKRLLTDTIVHDLRNPVAGIQGFLTLLKSDSDQLTESQRVALQEGERACVMLNAMVDNVLEISRMDEGKLEIVKEDVDLKALLEDTIKFLEPFAATRKKTIAARLPGGNFRIRTDEQILRRILFNLVMNSIRHAVGAKKVEIRTAREGSRTRVTVADDGPGIPKEYQARLFEKFGAHGLRAAGLKLDTGLGLVFCKMAADRMGAVLTLDSDRGKGTRVSILI
jgi:signal transduction histidine kinase